MEPPSKVPAVAAPAKHLHTYGLQDLRQLLVQALLLPLIRTQNGCACGCCFAAQGPLLLLLLLVVLLLLVLEQDRCCCCHHAACCSTP
jgi:hypothetical protein